MPRTPTSARPGKSVEQQRQRADRQRRAGRGSGRRARAARAAGCRGRPRRAAVCSSMSPVRARGAWARRGGPVTRTRARAPGVLGRSRSTPGAAPSSSRSSRVCRRLTTRSVAASRGPTATVQRPASIRTSVTWARETSSERWIRTKPAPAHSSSSVVSGTRIRWRAAGGVQPGVVAVRLDVGHVARGRTNRVTPPSSTGIWTSSTGAGAPVAAVDHPAYRLGQPLLAHRLEHVVDRPQVEGVDGVRLVGGDEDDRRRAAGTG